MTKFRSLAAFLLAAALTAAPADAQTVRPTGFGADPFSALVGKRARVVNRDDRQDSVERYVVAAQGRVFLFQPGEREGRLKFLCGDKDEAIDCVIDKESPAEEIYRLTPVRGPRGDTVWRNARGQTMLRISSYGGATIFERGDLKGLPAAKSFSEDPPLTLPQVSIERARLRAARATAIVSARIGSPIVFDIGAAAPAAGRDASVFADAVVRVAKGIDRVGADALGAKAIAARVKRVSFHAGDAPGLKLDGDGLDVAYNPALDVAGRPSSAEVARFLENSL